MVSLFCFLSKLFFYQKSRVQLVSEFRWVTLSLINTRSMDKERKFMRLILDIKIISWIVQVTPPPPTDVVFYLAGPIRQTNSLSCNGITNSPKIQIFLSLYYLMETNSINYCYNSLSVFPFSTI